MKLPLVVAAVVFASLGLSAQTPASVSGSSSHMTGTKTPINASDVVLRAFKTHDLVIFGEIHGNKQEYEWLRSLVSSPEFSAQVDDVVVEFGNSLYQKSVDRYIAGGNVRWEQVRKAWRNIVGAAGPPSPVYGSLYQAIREANISNRGKHQIRLLCSDPYIDWTKVKTREDIAPFLTNRDQWYEQVIKDEVIAKHHHALLIIGAGHILRRPEKSQLEQHLRSAGANPYLIVAGTNTVGGPGDFDLRFDNLQLPAVVSLKDSWVGELPAIPVIRGGEAGPGPFSLKLKDAADALLYLGPRETLTREFMPRAELDNTEYGREFQRRMALMFGEPAVISEKNEAPQFDPPPGGFAESPLPPPFCKLVCKLPPRPKLQ